MTARSIRGRQDQLADAITAFSGSMAFVYLHAVWFLVWIVANTLIFANGFDPYPFGLLTLVVSLEAIFLSTFVMLSQNRQAARSEERAQEDFAVNLRAEVWAFHVGQALGLDADAINAEIEAKSRSKRHLLPDG